MEPSIARTDARVGELDLEVIFMEHYGFVCRSLAHMGVQPPAVEDVAQDVFVVVHKRMRTFERGRDLRSWLWGIARHVAHTHRRSVARTQRKLRVVPTRPDPRLPDETLELRERAAVVERFLSTLRPKLRDVFVLCDIEGLSAPEVSETLDVKLNTVYSRLRLARRRFERFVAHEGADA